MGEHERGTYSRPAWPARSDHASRRRLRPRALRALCVRNGDGNQLLRMCRVHIQMAGILGIPRYLAAISGPDSTRDGEFLHERSTACVPQADPLPGGLSQLAAAPRRGWDALELR